MSRLSRFTQKLFGSAAGTNEMSEFGSLAAGTPTRYAGATITPTIIQQLGNFLGGWKSAQVGSGNPALEDMNSLCYLYAYQLGYILQNGIPEWDSGTTYFIGQVVGDGTGKAYYSIVDNNTNHVVTDLTKWAPWINILASQRTRAVGTTVGVGGIALSNSSATFSTTSGTLTDVTNLSVTITTTGNPVIISCVPDGDAVQASRFQVNTSFSTQVGWAWALLNGATKVGQGFLGWSENPDSGNSSIIYYPASTIYVLDTPVAGTYTYKLQVRVNTATSVFVGYMKLTASEFF